MIQLEIAQLKRSWIEDSLASVLRYIADRAPEEIFTSDDFRVITGTPPNNAWMGALLAKLKAEGRIKRHGYQVSDRPEANGREIKTWVRK